MEPPGRTVQTPVSIKATRERSSSPYTSAVAEHYTPAVISSAAAEHGFIVSIHSSVIVSAHTTQKSVWEGVPCASPITLVRLPGSEAQHRVQRLVEEGAAWQARVVVSDLT